VQWAQRALWLGVHADANSDMNLIEALVFVLAFALSVVLGAHFLRYGWWVMLPAVFFGLIILAALLTPPAVYVRRQFVEWRQRLRGMP
jgi:hypothetical protein